MSVHCRSRFAPRTTLTQVCECCHSLHGSDDGVCSGVCRSIVKRDQALYVPQYWQHRCQRAHDVVSKPHASHLKCEIRATGIRCWIVLFQHHCAAASTDDEPIPAGLFFNGMCPCCGASMKAQLNFRYCRATSQGFSHLNGAGFFAPLENRRPWRSPVIAELPQKLGGRLSQAFRCRRACTQRLPRQSTCVFLIS